MSLLLLNVPTPLVPTDTLISFFSQLKARLFRCLQQGTVSSEYLLLVHHLRRTLEIMQAQRVHTCQVIVVERKCTSCLLLQEIQQLLDEVGILLTSLSPQNVYLKRLDEKPLVVLNRLFSVLEEFEHHSF